MDEGRRGFLRGVFGGVTAAGLIVAASPKEIAAFASPLTKNAPVVLDQPPTRQNGVASGMHLYNERGEFVAIITAMHMSNVHAMDVTSHHDTDLDFIRGIDRDPEVEVRLVGWVEMGTDGWPVLRGQKS